MTAPLPTRAIFWGVRGSAPAPAAGALRYGGNTACVQVESGNEVLIFDAGTGIRDLGSALGPLTGAGHRRIHVFLTHFHRDHIDGLPFFSPLYDPQACITFYATGGHGAVRSVLERQMLSPYFPIQLDGTPSQKEYVELDGQGVHAGAALVRPFPLNHPQGAYGFRIETPGETIVYAPDCEHGNASLDRELRRFSEGADQLIHDATYTPEEYDDHRGWGHSTWREAARVAEDAKVRKLVLFHHAITRTDQELDDIAGQTRRYFENAEAARENGWARWKTSTAGVAEPANAIISAEVGQLRAQIHAMRQRLEEQQGRHEEQFQSAAAGARREILELQGTIGALREQLDLSNSEWKQERSVILREAGSIQRELQATIAALRDELERA